MQLKTAELQPRQYLNSCFTGTLVIFSLKISFSGWIDGIDQYSIIQTSNSRLGSINDQDIASVTYFNCYPNPTSDEVTISLGDHFDDKVYLVEVINQTGNKALQLVFSNEEA